MGEANVSEIESSVMTEPQFKTLYENEFQHYMKNPVLNQTFHLMKEAKQHEEQIARVHSQLVKYVQLAEEMVKHQETFTNIRRSLPKVGMRDVGVYVNMSTPDEKVQVVADSRRIHAKAVNVPVGMVKPLVSPSASVLSRPQTAGNKLGTPKRSVVDVVDLTADEDRSQPKIPHSRNTQVKQERVNSAPVQMTAARFPQLATSVIGQPKTAPVTVMLPPGLFMRSSKPGNTFSIPKAVIAARVPGPLTPKPIVQSPKTLSLNLPPLPGSPKNQSKLVGLPESPPKPVLTVSKPATSGVALTWNLPLKLSHAKIKSYQLFGYEETSAAVDSSAWKRIGEIVALPLPMACTLTQFAKGKRYHFIVRAVDVHSRVGPFSDVSTINLMK